MGDELVRVDRFEELATGMRVVIKPCQWAGRGCRGVHRGVLGSRKLRRAIGNLGAIFDADTFTVIGHHHDFVPMGIWAANVAAGRVYRFVEDLGISDQLAAEENDPETANPYLARTVVGTGGREETRILTRERGR